jgi:mannan endo-1,4-beta-mannosidase
VASYLIVDVVFDHVQAWISVMAAHVKEQDPNHMLTVGEEGFYSKASCSAAINPGSWADSASGQNSKLNHALKDIDFVSFHLWPDNWNQVTLEFATEWISQHVQDARCAYAAMISRAIQ